MLQCNLIKNVIKYVKLIKCEGNLNRNLEKGKRKFQIIFTKIKLTLKIIEYQQFKFIKYLRYRKINKAWINQFPNIFFISKKKKNNLKRKGQALNEKKIRKNCQQKKHQQKTLQHFQKQKTLKTIEDYQNKIKQLNQQIEEKDRTREQLISDCNFIGRLIEKKQQSIQKLKSRFLVIYEQVLLQNLDFKNNQRFIYLRNNEKKCGFRKLINSNYISEDQKQINEQIDLLNKKYESRLKKNRTQLIQKWVYRIQKCFLQSQKQLINKQKINYQFIFLKDESQKISRKKPSQVINQRYIILQILKASHNNCQSYLVFDKNSFNKYVAKSCPIQYMTQQNYKQLELLKGQDKKFLANLIDIFIQKDKYVVVIFQQVEGIDMKTLFRKCNQIQYKDKTMTVKQAKIIFYQILQALHQLNLNNLFHGNLRPQKIIINNHEIKLVGYGFFSNANQKQNQIYLSPQSFKQQYRQTKRFSLYNFDMWAFGIIFYECLFGAKPLQGIQIKNIANIGFFPKIYEFPHKNGIDKDCVQLIQKCLEVNYQKRITIKQTRKQSYLKIK